MQQDSSTYSLNTCPCQAFSFAVITLSTKWEDSEGSYNMQHNSRQTVWVM